MTVPAFIMSTLPLGKGTSTLGSTTGSNFSLASFPNPNAQFSNHISVKSVFQ